METALRPRDIQSRIRSGETVAELADVADMPIERIEAFAAPVLAEREHVAMQAQSSSVRRRGETSGHRNLRTTVTERLLGKGVDIDDVEWDAWRMDDGRWVVSVVYLIEEAERRALFHFDAKARFSVAGDDGGHWMLRDKVHASDDGDNEPTVDLTDELALVRATQTGAETADPDSDDEAGTYPGHLSAVPDTDDVGDLIDEDTLAEDLIDWDRPEPEALEAEEPDPTPVEPVEAASEPDEPVETASEPDGPVEEPAGLDVLDDMLGGDGFAEDSVVVYSGLSDAAAVPDTDNAGWEPAIVVDYPVQPDLLEEQPALVDLDPSEEQEELAEARKERRSRRKRSPAGIKKSAPKKKPTESPTTSVEPVETAPEPDKPEPDKPELDKPEPDKPEPDKPEPEAASGLDKLDQRAAEPAPKKKPTRKKRAQVPSWDEIMFGSPRNNRDDN